MPPVAVPLRVVLKTNTVKPIEVLKPMSYVIFGNVKDPGFQLAKLTAQAAAQKLPKLVFIEIKPMTSFEFADTRRRLKEKYPKMIDAAYPCAAIEIDGKHIRAVPEFLKWVQERYEVVDSRNQALLETIAEIEYKAFLKTIRKSRTIVFADVTIEGFDVGRLLFETVHQFLEFVKGGRSGPFETELSYKGNAFTRLVKNGWIQGGDILLPQGKVYREDPIADENFIMKHDSRGTLSMVNHGPNTNYSAFMILFKAMPYFDKKYVSFGRLIDGEDVLAKMEDIPTTFEKPESDIEISNVGIYSE